MQLIKVRLLALITLNKKVNRGTQYSLLLCLVINVNNKNINSPRIPVQIYLLHGNPFRTFSGINANETGKCNYKDNTYDLR